MSVLIAAAPPIPLDSTAGRYVAAAYIVVLALILVYLAIMAVRQSKIERELAELLAREQAAAAADQRGAEQESDVG